jgi:hypothetical protein
LNTPAHRRSIAAEASLSTERLLTPGSETGSLKADLRTDQIDDDPMLQFGKTPLRLQSFLVLRSLAKHLRLAEALCGGDGRFPQHARAGYFDSTTPK